LGSARDAAPLVRQPRTPLNTTYVADREQAQLMGTARPFFMVISVVAALVAGSRVARGQTSGPSTQRSTSSGVYSADQATRGRDVYAMQCKSCHTPASHTGAIFAAWWDRKPLSDLYQFIVTRMPKNEPGSLQPDEYADVLAYLLKLNELPSGSDPLPADSMALKKIRIEVGKKDP
jgi:mono/diheme cytochrome c family protein